MKKFLAQHYLDNSRSHYLEKVAITFADKNLTYDGLYKLSNQLANCLKSKGVSRQDRVGIFLKRSIDSIIAINGILKADAIYVPIDAKSPIERFRKIIDDCEPRALICDRGTLKKAEKNISNNISIFVLEDQDELDAPLRNSYVYLNDIKSQSDASPYYQNIDNDIAYILYTSGSTGDPKGVMISHLNITNYIEWAVDCFEINQNEKILSTAPFHFDMSTFDIYCALKRGATLCIAPESLLLFPTKLLDLIDKEKISLWKGVSSLLMYVARTIPLSKKKLASLNKIIFAGENLPTRYLIEWMEAFPDKQFYNAYGPTEATGISTYYHVARIPENSTERIPIGRPCENTEVYVLTEDGALADTGEIGELCIRGSGLSRGYWNDEAKTAKVFVQNPISAIPGDRIYHTGDLALLNKEGNYELVGRKDNQVKNMGYRIDLAEIENGLISTGKIKDAAVILYRSEKYSVDELVAMVVTDSNSSPEKLRENLKNIIPAYMMPHRIFVVDDIPRTDRGKIDRKNIYATLSKSLM